MIENDRLLAALVTATSIPEAAKQLGVGEATIYRRLRDPAFQEELASRRREILRQALVGLHCIFGEAVETLRRNLGPGSPASVQVSAARIVVESVIKAADALDVDERLRQLEDQARQADSDDSFLRSLERQARARLVSD